jgi:hypothetical protein
MKSDSSYPYFRMNDLAIPFILILLIFTFKSRMENSPEIVLEVHSAEGITQYDLSVDTAFTVTGNLGEMQIAIDNTRARITSSPCPGQDCVNQGWIDGSGDIAVCVPSGVFIVITSSDDSLSLDAVSY